MFRRSLTWVLARAISDDVHRLFRDHGVDALFMARHAVMAARERDRTGHWSRVLAQVEIRSGQRPW